MDLSELIAEGKIKRYFRARKKIEAPGLISHITQRAAGKEPLFVEDKDYLYMLGLLKKTAEKFSLRMFAFVLMPNHCHLLFQLRSKNLYEAMRILFMRYAIYFNLKYERKGHLFGGPYRQAACFDDSYLLTSSLYIHLNPVKAGLVEHFSRYRWSTCNLYCRDKRKQTYVDSKFILNLLSPDIDEARKEYIKKLNQAAGVEMSVIPKDESAVSKFRDSLSEKFPGFFISRARRKKYIGFSSAGYIDDLELEKILASVGEKKRLRKPSEKKARKFLVEQLMARGFRKQEIAKKLGITRQSLYRILK